MFKFITNLFQKKSEAPVAQTPYKIEAPKADVIAPKVNPVKPAKKKAVSGAPKAPRKPRAPKAPKA